MDLNHYQQLARETAVYPTIGHPIVYCALGLTGEAGEVSDKVKKMYRDNNGELDRKTICELVLELGDVLWYIANFAHELGFSLDDVANINYNKLKRRQKTNTLSGVGDHR